jgi:23S rRNA pseudouridine1911/1915/1917 synthase
MPADESDGDGRGGPDICRQVPREHAGQRLDQVASSLFADYSRSRLQTWIRSGHLLVDGSRWRPRDKLSGGELLELWAQPEAGVEMRPQSIPLSIVYEDEALLVVDKPVGLVVHPGAGNPDMTLANALLHYDPALADVPRAGIVHRLDKDTSGLLVVARNLRAHATLVAQLQARTVKREYRAIVYGVVTSGGVVDAPVGRHPVERRRMAVVAQGKSAVTHYRVLERYRSNTLLKLWLETGRTHQIRVHMSYIRYPLVGDPLYGGRMRVPAGADASLVDRIRGMKRQALHAARLGLEHPVDRRWREWRSELPEDFQELREALRDG